MRIISTITIMLLVAGLSFAEEPKAVVNISIGNSGEEELTDYQVMLKLSGKDLDFSLVSGTGAGMRFFLEDKKLPYWVESWNAENEEAVIWLKVPSLAPQTITKARMECYGSANPSYLSESSGDKVFEFFDSFDGDYISEEKWFIVGNDVYGGGGTLTINDAEDSHIASRKKFGPGYMVENKVYLGGFDTSFLRNIPLGWVEDQIAVTGFADPKIGVYFYGDTGTTTTIEAGNAQLEPANRFYILGIYYNKALDKATFHVDREVYSQVKTPLEKEYELAVYIGNDRLPPLTVEWVFVRKYAGEKVVTVSAK